MNFTIYANFISHVRVYIYVHSTEQPKRKIQLEKHKEGGREFRKLFSAFKARGRAFFPLFFALARRVFVIYELRARRYFGAHTNTH